MKMREEPIATRSRSSRRAASAPPTGARRGERRRRRDKQAPSRPAAARRSRRGGRAGRSGTRCSRSKEDDARAHSDGRWSRHWRRNARRRRGERRRDRRRLVSERRPPGPASRQPMPETPRSLRGPSLSTRARACPCRTRNLGLFDESRAEERKPDETRSLLPSRHTIPRRAGPMWPAGLTLRPASAPPRGARDRGRRRHARHER